MGGSFMHRRNIRSLVRRTERTALRLALKQKWRKSYTTYPIGSYANYADHTYLKQKGHHGRLALFKSAEEKAFLSC